MNPEIDTRYENGKIYRIDCNLTGDTYIGSTINPLSVRLSGHRCDDSCSSREIIAGGDYQISLIESYPCNNRTQLEFRERYWSDLIPCINTNRARVTPEERLEYYRENIESIRAYKAGYYKANTAAINLKSAAYREKQADRNVKTECSCGGGYTRANTVIHSNTNRHQRWVRAQRLLCEFL
jgi:hypothetical protein